MAKKSKNPLTLYEKLEPEKLAKASGLLHEQILYMLRKTPPQFVKTRPGRGGGMWKYVTTHYVETVLNYTFAWDWDFEVVRENREGHHIYVYGKLTVNLPNGKVITKGQYGQAEVKMNPRTGKPISLGDDYKAAASDSLKKCASMFGIASDVYGGEEFREVEMVDDKDAVDEPPEDLADVAARVDEPSTIDKCTVCTSPIPRVVADYSVAHFGKLLCRPHQRDASAVS